jgi:hypothetical protein
MVIVQIVKRSSNVLPTCSFSRSLQLRVRIAKRSKPILTEMDRLASPIAQLDRILFVSYLSGLDAEGHEKIRGAPATFFDVTHQLECDRACLAG